MCRCTLTLQVSANVQCQNNMCASMCVRLFIFLSHVFFFLVQPCEIACVPVHVHVLVCVRVRQREGDNVL